MAALPYMQLYIADYLADTMHLTTEEHGAYLLLMFNYWQTGKPIPKARLSRIARLSNERWTIVEVSLNEFFADNGTEWVHERIERDLAAVHASQEQRSAAGKASAAARKNRTATKAERKSSARSTPVEDALSGKPTNKDTDTDKSNTPLTPQGGNAQQPSKPASKSQRSKPKRALPVPFVQTPEMLAWAAEKAPAVNLDRETERFIDYWTGQGSTKADWPATWRNWIRRAQDDLERRGMATPVAKDPSDTSWIDEDDGL